MRSTFLPRQSITVSNFPMPGKSLPISSSRQHVLTYFIRNLLESALAETGDWTEESIARAEYRLSLVLDRMRRPDEAEAKRNSAVKKLELLWKGHAISMPHWKQLDLEVAFDYLVSVDSGRSTLGKYEREPLLNTVDNLCEILTARLESNNDWAEMVVWRIMNVEETDIWQSWVHKQQSPRVFESSSV
jgi:hypothetical protein